MHTEEHRVLQVVEKEIENKGDSVTIRDIENYPYGDMLPAQASAAFQALVNKGVLKINGHLELSVPKFYISDLENFEVFYVIGDTCKYIKIPTFYDKKLKMIVNAVSENGVPKRFRTSLETDKPTLIRSNT